MKELKKHILLKSSKDIPNINLIIDRDKDINQVTYKDVIELKVNTNYWSYPLEYFDFETSDNIIDLVVVGDLVKVGTDSPNEVLTLYNHKEFGKSATISYFNYPLPLSYITELFKKQPNGDFKRYEVNENGK